MRGVSGAIASSYVDFLANRGVLDNILADCKDQSLAIEDALSKLSSDEIARQPALLSEKCVTNLFIFLYYYIITRLYDDFLLLNCYNFRCVLHPYQQVGLNWLVLMHKLGLNAILGDEMVCLS